jgi:hypothetical protein
MAFIGFLSFVPLGDETFLKPEVGIFLMIVLMLIALAAWLSKE